MEMKNQLKSYVVIALLSSGATLGAYQLFNLGSSATISDAPSAFTSNVSNINTPGNPGEFTYAAEKTTPAVVHIKTKMEQRARQFSSPFEDLFGGFGDPFGGGGGRRQAPQQQEASGSGVIISSDGYIVTNNHVVAEASEITVMLNDKREFKAKVISTDPSSDLAVIQIKASGLPFLTFGDSDNLKVGEWVLAVGNPFNLESTVTAGIISAKGRQNIIDRDGDGAANPLESFIQTDAAVNPGNSGGALVNLKGELIGINTAIYSRTGQFAGYSFAVPSNIARKIIEDIMEYGNVQRGILGVEGGELNSKSSKELGISQTEGFYVNKVTKRSGAEKAGLQKGDVIIKLDNQSVATFADLSGYINTKRPNDKVAVTIIREGKNKVIPVILSKNDNFNTEFKGLELENIDSNDKKRFRLNYGVKIKAITNENLKAYERELLGNIILSIDNLKATDIETVSKLLNNKEEGQSIRIEMINQNGEIFRIII